MSNPVPTSKPVRAAVERLLHRLLPRRGDSPFLPREEKLNAGSEPFPPDVQGSHPASRHTATHRTDRDAYPGDAHDERPPYPGDFTGAFEIVYDPHPDGAPDPGEIVWAWVPFEEDHTRGKDRPVLIVGHDGPWLLALQLSRKDTTADAARERRAGRIWVDIGSGAWDPRGRPSEVRVNRILRIDEGAIRREGSVLAEEIFERVAAGIENTA